METFYPFIHEKKKEVELEPLYIEVIPMPLLEKPKYNEEEQNIIIIQL